MRLDRCVVALQGQSRVCLRSGGLRQFALRGIPVNASETNLAGRQLTFGRIEPPSRRVERSTVRVAEITICSVLTGPQCVRFCSLVHNPILCRSASPGNAQLYVFSGGTRLNEQRDEKPRCRQKALKTMVAHTETPRYSAMLSLRLLLERHPRRVILTRVTGLLPFRVNDDALPWQHMVALQFEPKFLGC
jgi:hypothetical protein